MEKLEILVVDDNKGNRASAELLKEDGHKVRTVKTFTDAITLLEKNKYDVVLTDLMFPFGEKREAMSVGFKEHMENDRYVANPLGYAVVFHSQPIHKTFYPRHLLLLCNIFPHSFRDLPLLMINS